MYIPSKEIMSFITERKISDADDLLKTKHFCFEALFEKFKKSELFQSIRGMPYPSCI